MTVTGQGSAYAISVDDDMVFPAYANVLFWQPVVTMFMWRFIYRCLWKLIYSYLIVCLWRRGARHGDEAFKKVSSVQPSADRQVKVCWQFLYKWAIFDCWENPRPEGSLRPVVRFIGKFYYHCLYMHVLESLTWRLNNEIWYELFPLAIPSLGIRA